MLRDDEYNHRVRMRRLENNRESETLSANRSKEREHRRIMLQLEYDHRSMVLLRELGYRQSVLDMELGQERAILAIRQQGPGSNTSKSGEMQPIVFGAQNSSRRKRYGKSQRRKRREGWRCPTGGRHSYE